MIIGGSTMQPIVSSRPRGRVRARLPVLLLTAAAIGGQGDCDEAGPRFRSGCVASFDGPVTRLDRDYGYQNFQLATWPGCARFDARGARWTSLIDGAQRRRGLSPLEIGVDWETNIDCCGTTISVENWVLPHFLVAHTLIAGARWSDRCWRLVTDPVWGRFGL